MTECHALSNGTAEDALAYFQEVLWLHLVKYIPRRNVKITKRSHPWLNERSQKAIQRKNDAENSAGYENEQEACAKILAEERARYVQELKQKLANLPKSSKQWWRINREFLEQEGPADFYSYTQG